MWCKCIQSPSDFINSLNLGTLCVVAMEQWRNITSRCFELQQFWIYGFKINSSQSDNWKVWIYNKKVISNNKSPKGHWSLTWVQWALLLKVRFFSKSKRLTAIFVKSVRTATITTFQFRIRDAFCLLLLHSDLKKKYFGEKAPHWPI